MKLSRIRKLTWKLLLVYAAVVVLIFCADRSEDKWRRWNFWSGVALLAFAQWIRFWAAGHLVKNKVLTVTGPYAYVKNPLYIGTFLGMIGFALVAMGDPRHPWYFRFLNWMMLGAGVLAFVAYYVPYKKKREGDRLHELFGEAWDHYDRSVRDYVPRCTRYERAADAPWSWRAACENSEQWTPLAIVAGVAAILFNARLLEWIGVVM
ncbi:MAG: isoprenylcysteine carboxylmethyltransferase family protein [Planctomycetes bacterium]|nr:isoprenylcysteine carboxylmethyltransferase family protein [Planctomycetota bacterium]